MKKSKLKELERRVELLENGFKKSELTVLPVKWTDVPLSIREVQVKVSSQEEANELAEIAKECGEPIDGVTGALKIIHGCTYFRYGHVKDCYRNSFGVYLKDNKYKTITLQQFKELFSKPREIDWSKKGQLVESDIFVLITSGKENKNVFEGTIVFSKIGPFKLGNHSKKWLKDSFTLLTTPITLQND